MERNYVAFISYRHKPLDTAVAKRLHTLIEHYRIPKRFRKQGAKQPGLVFRDRDELPLSDNLNQDIRTALDHSQFLIVVCTPDAPLSWYVQEEIRYFLTHHSRDRVLAILASGTPEESFPEQLTHVYGADGSLMERIEPLAANIVAPTTRQSLRLLDAEVTRLMAAILGCPYDALRQRQRQYRRRRVTAAIALVSAVALSFILLLVLKNIEVSRQYHQSQINESQALAHVSAQQLKDGDRLGAVASALDALPSGAIDRPYVAQAEYALSRALYVYAQERLLPDCRITQADSIADARISTDGLYVQTLDVFDVQRFYTAKNGLEITDMQTLLGAQARFSLDAQLERSALTLTSTSDRDAGYTTHHIQLADGAATIDQEIISPYPYDWGHSALLENGNAALFCKGGLYIIDRETGGVAHVESPDITDYGAQATSILLPGTDRLLCTVDSAIYLFDAGSGALLCTLPTPAQPRSIHWVDDSRGHAVAVLANGDLYEVFVDSDAAPYERYYAYQIGRVTASLGMEITRAFGPAVLGDGPMLAVPRHSSESGMLLTLPRRDTRVIGGYNAGDDGTGYVHVSPSGEAIVQARQGVMVDDAWHDVYAVLSTRDAAQEQLVTVPFSGALYGFSSDESLLILGQAVYDLQTGQLRPLLEGSELLASAAIGAQGERPAIQLMLTEAGGGDIDLWCWLDGALAWNERLPAGGYVEDYETDDFSYTPITLGANGWALIRLYDEKYDDWGETPPDRFLLVDALGQKHTIIDNPCPDDGESLLSFCLAENHALVAFLGAQEQIMIFDCETGKAVHTYPSPVPPQYWLRLDFVMDDAQLAIEQYTERITFVDSADGTVRLVYTPPVADDGAMLGPGSDETAPWLSFVTDGPHLFVSRESAFVDSMYFTGLCIDTGGDEWAIVAEIPALITYIPAAGQIVALNTEDRVARDMRVVMYPHYGTEALVSLGERLLAEREWPR